jgi:hypothetical protein
MKTLSIMTKPTSKSLKKVLIFLLVVCSITSCIKDDLMYSCNPEVNEWAKSSLTDIQKMARQDWLAIGDYSLQRAAFVAFSPAQKQALWIGKMEEVLTLDWTEREKQHIQYLLDFIKNNTAVFSNENGPDDEAELLRYKWEEYAQKELGWNRELLHDLVYTPRIMNANKKVVLEPTLPRRKSSNESGTEEPKFLECYCRHPQNVGCGSGDCYHRSPKCREVRNCGFLNIWFMCNGICL